MGEAHQDLIAVELAGDKALPFQSPDRRRLDQPVQGVVVDRFYEGHELEEFPLGIAQDAETHGHQIDQAECGVDLTAYAPDSTIPDQLPRVQRSNDQFSQEHGIPLAPTHQQAHRGFFHWGSERREQQFLDGSLPQGSQIDTFGQAVLPQRRDRVGDNLTRTYGRKDSHRPHHGELMDQNGRSVVQQMGIIDEQQEATVPGRFHHSPDVAPQELALTGDGGIAITWIGRQKGRHRPERQLPAGRGSGESDDPHSATGCLIRYQSLLRLGPCARIPSTARVSAS